MQITIYCFAGILMAGSLGSEELTAVNDSGSKAGFTLVITMRYYVCFPTTFKDSVIPHDMSLFNKKKCF